MFSAHTPTALDFESLPKGSLLKLCSPSHPGLPLDTGPIFEITAFFKCKHLGGQNDATFIIYAPNDEGLRQINSPGVF